MKDSSLSAGWPRMPALASIQPPEDLRDRILRTHARRRQGGHFLLALASFAVGALIMPMVIDRRLPSHEDVDWQARSRTLEQSWRRQGDVAWLLDDDRAGPLVYRLQQVDASIAAALAVPEPSGSAHLAGLWRERSEVLAALVEAREHGGVAVLL